MPHREIAKINWVAHVCLTEHKNLRRVLFKKRLTFNKNSMKVSNIHKLHFKELCGSKLSGLLPFDKMVIIQRVKNRLKTEK